MKKYFNVIFGLMLCLSLVGGTLATAAPVSAQTGGISGHVESEGANVSGAEVAVILYESIYGYQQYDGWGTTDANGEYTIIGRCPNNIRAYWCRYHRWRASLGPVY